jgi:hypothetical protein
VLVPASTAPLISVSVGPRNAYTDERGLRMYRWKGTDYPSVTTIRRMAGLPYGLHEWAIGKVTTRAVEGYQDLGKIIDNGTPEAVKAARTWLRAASIEERDRAASIGIRVHDAATSGRPLTEVGIDVAPYLRQYLDWLSVSRAEVLTVERQVWNLKVGYAGTFDLLIRFPNGSTWVVDIKTGKGIYPEHAIQCIAYAMADFVGEDDTVDVEASKQLREASGIAILHLGQTGWSWAKVIVTPELWQSFTGLLNFARFIHANPKIDTLTTGAREGHAA